MCFRSHSDTLLDVPLKHSRVHPEVDVPMELSLDFVNIVYSYLHQ